MEGVPFFVLKLHQLVIVTYVLATIADIIGVLVARTPCLALIVIIIAYRVYGLANDAGLCKLAKSVTIYGISAR